MIIIDEPELGLHHKFIDRLTDKILYSCKQIQFVLCTHSPRLVKNIFKDAQSSSNIINLRYIDKYTVCAKMNKFNENRQFYFVNDEYVNSYFSRMLLIVEGQSELELLNNKYLKELYPILKNIDVIQGAADDIVEGIVLPNERNYRADYIILKDLDKIIKICKNNKKEIVNQFKMQEKGFKYSNREDFYYGRKRIQTLNTRKRIEMMTTKCKFHYNLPFYSSIDANYYELINLIKKYFENYNTFILRTTIEGALVNYDNYYIFWDFFKSRSKNNIVKLEEVYLKMKTNDKVNLLRLLVNGKTDYILNLKELDKISSDLEKIILENRISKTNWITEWLEFYFMYIFNLMGYSENINLLDEKGLQKIRNKFFNHFKELTVLINCMYKKFKN